MSGSFATLPQICHVGAKHCCAGAELHRLLRPGRWRRDTVMRFSLLELRRKVRRGPLPLIFKGAGVDASVSLPQRLFRPRARSQNTQDYFHACNAASGVAAPPAENGFLRNQLCSKCATRSNRDTSRAETVPQDRWATCSQPLACYSTKTECFARYENTWR